LFSWKKIREEVSNGRDLLVYEGKVYDLTKWKTHHPGGDLAITHLVGMDATNQIRGNHSDEIIQKKMPLFLVGSLEDTSLSPVEQAFRKLGNKLLEDGLYEKNFSFWYKEGVKLAILLTIALSILFLGTGSWTCVCLGAFFMAFYWQQSAFVAHDSGHCGITNDIATDYRIGFVLANCLGGVSIGWWKDGHYVHHIVTNEVENDPDIQHMPVFAVTEKFFKGIYSTYHEFEFKFDAVAQFLVQFQHLLYFPLLLFGRFLLYANSFRFLLLNHRARRRRYQELLGLLCFHLWYWSLVMALVPSWPKRAAYVLLSHALTFILHVQITLSHFCMDTIDRQEDEEFVKHQLRTTLDVDCPTWMDWFHGGLQFQVIHHLFPRLPRHNLRQAQRYVMEFCKEHGLQYHLQTFSAGTGMTLSCLKQVADQAAFLYKVGTSKYMLGHMEPVM